MFPANQFARLLPSSSIYCMVPFSVGRGGVAVVSMAVSRKVPSRVSNKALGQKSEGCGQFQPSNKLPSAGLDAANLANRGLQRQIEGLLVAVNANGEGNRRRVVSDALQANYCHWMRIGTIVRRSCKGIERSKVSSCRGGLRESWTILVIHLNGGGAVHGHVGDRWRLAQRPWPPLCRSTPD